MTPTRRKLTSAVILLLLVAHGVKGGGFSAPGKVEAVTYVYEARDGGIPNPVLAGLNSLNSQNILATTFDDDTTNGKNNTPAQYKVAVEAARKAGLPALVVEGGGHVIRVVKGPTTDTQVLDSVK